MKAVVLNGLYTDQIWSDRFKNLISKSFESSKFDYDLIDLHSKNVNKCRGCFKCWVKTPGECVVKDDSQSICKLIINSDLIVFLTPIVYGGYSSNLKTMLDKIIPLISPFFKRYSGEVHHYPRYDKYPSILGIGIQSYTSEDEVACFKNLVYRNSLNFHSPAMNSQTFMTSEDDCFINERLNEILLKMEETIYA